MRYRIHREKPRFAGVTTLPSFPLELAGSGPTGRTEWPWVAQWDVVVRPSSFGAQEASAAIGRAMPGRGVHVESRIDGLSVQGTVANAAEAERAMATARGYATAKQIVENRLQVTGNAQVTL